MSFAGEAWEPVVAAAVEVATRARKRLLAIGVAVSMQKKVIMGTSRETEKAYCEATGTDVNVCMTSSINVDSHYKFT